MPRRIAISRQTEAAIRAAHGAGVPVKRTRTQAYTLKVGANKTLTLLAADGVATATGRFYYSTLLQLPLPAAYAYEQPLLQGKWVKGFDGNDILMRRRDSEGKWQPTRDGINYFKYLRDEFLVSVQAVRPMRSNNAMVQAVVGGAGVGTE